MYTFHFGFQQIKSYKIFVLLYLIILLSGCTTTPRINKVAIRYPTYIGTTDKIAFTDGVRHGDTYLFDMKTEKLVRTLSSAGYIGDLSASSDGKLFAFAKSLRTKTEESVEIFLHNFLTDEAIQITNGGVNREPFFSGDSRYLFFAKDIDSSFRTSRQVIIIYDIEKRQVLKELGPFGSIGFPTSNYDGSLIVFSGAQTMAEASWYDVDMILLNTVTGKYESLLKLWHYLTIPCAISKDGRSVYYLGNVLNRNREMSDQKVDGLYVLDIVSRKTTLLVPIKNWDTISFDIRPDEMKVLFTDISVLKEISLDSGQIKSTTVLRPSSIEPELSSQGDRPRP